MSRRCGEIQKTKVVAKNDVVAFQNNLKTSLSHLFMSMPAESKSASLPATATFSLSLLNTDFVLVELEEIFLAS